MTRLSRWLSSSVLAAVVSGCASTGVAPVAAPRYSDTEAYLAARAQMIAEARGLRLGAGLELTAAEVAADQRLLRLRAAELARSRHAFPPARSFLLDETKRAYQQSPLFAVMQRLPKGAVLHAHLSAMGDFRWVVERAVASPRAYVFMDEQPDTPRGSLRLADAPPGPGWRRVSDVRGEGAAAIAFDRQAFEHLTLGQEDVERDDMWSEFVAIFARTRGLFGDEEFAADYFDHAVEMLVRDNVQYLELRSQPVDDARIERARRHDSTFDVKFIPAAGRSLSRDQVGRALSSTLEQRAARPDRVKGFDLVQEEDRGNTNLFYLENLLEARREAARRGMDLPLYLHSGESNWADNENVYDALLLGAPRIGHALTLIKHPLLLREVEKRDIAIEVCPLSNQILGFVSDLRTHPAAHYINAGLPVVLSSDDPGLFRSSLSHDFYTAFMSWDLDLRALKQIAMNSLLYSTMTASEKSRAMSEWQRRWSAFITWVNVTYPDA